LNHQNLSIERYRVRGTDYSTSKSQPPRAKAPRARDFARACHDGPSAIVRHAAVFFAFAAALSLTNCKGLVRQMWERAMRAGIVAGCVALAILTGGCDSNDSRFFRYGIGTNLYSEDIVQATQYQDIYLTELCRQAVPMLVTTETVCINAGLSINDWDLIVQAGLNDIDRRCDAYLAWLDDRKRTNSAVLKQIGDTLAVSQGIMRLSGVGADPITMAGLAFGFATNTFTNVNSRLLLEVDKTTVQTLVLRRRADYRLQLRDVRVQNKPAVVHALRSYLNICTPFTIETDINSTITVFQQVGAVGLDRRGPLVSPDTVGVPATARTRVNVGGQVDPKPVIAEIYKSYLANYDPNVHSSTYVEGVLNALCVPPADYRSSTKVRGLINAYETGIHQGSSRARIDGVLDVNELRALTRMGPCPPDFRNAYERTTFQTATAQSIAKPLSNVPGVGTVSESTPLRELRAKIITARRAVGMEDRLVPDQITRDFFDRLDQ
jgi:hypothetical protein